METIPKTKWSHRRDSFSIRGMTCTNCVKHIRQELDQLPGIVNAELNLESEKAMIKYNPDEVTTSKIIEAIRNAGYDACVDPETIWSS